MRIYLIRHGLTEMNKLGIPNAELDEPLASEGKEQAKHAAKSLPKNIRQIYSSPQKRAAQTAEILATASGLPVLHHPGLTEIRMGSLAGTAWTEMPNGKDLKNLHRSVRFDYTAHGGESVEAVTNRLKEFIKMVETRHSNDEVLVVTHGGVIRVLKFLENKEAIYDTTDNATVVVFDTTKILN